MAACRRRHRRPRVPDVRNPRPPALHAAGRHPHASTATCGPRPRGPERPRARGGAGTVRSLAAVGAPARARPALDGRSLTNCVCPPARAHALRVGAGALPRPRLGAAARPALHNASGLWRPVNRRRVPRRTRSAFHLAGRDRERSHVCSSRCAPRARRPPPGRDRRVGRGRTRRPCRWQRRWRPPSVWRPRRRRRSTRSDPGRDAP